MLSDKRWKLDALMRLLVRVFVCIFAGSVLVSALQVVRGGGKISFWFFPLAIAALACLGMTLVIIRKPWVLENFVRRMVLLLIFFYAGFFLCAYAQKLAGPPHHSVVQMLVATLSFQGAALVLVGHFLREQNLGWAEAFGLKHLPLHALLIGIIVACVFFVPGRQLQKLSSIVMERVTRKPAQEQQAVQTMRGAASWVQRAFLAVVTILLAPVAEEILFRGILYQGIKQAGFPRIALWGTSLLFAGVHMNLPTFLPLFILALVLAMVYERTNNLLAPITAHSFFNALNFVIFFLEQLAGPGSS
ncbi:MAG TPA: CPBP family intramembrane glutamic endopeptidase [Methylomirabilota bacterium]|jgi:membrane protease YdiL (CAAX protease family)|nr:CPBP family intramembrane glutamic endopeptidase [Methylomirabilota bacterium]